MTIPRGIRNNNPGNVRYTGTKWKGLADPPSDGSFCVFKTPEYGIRAIYVIISNYYTIHNIDTIRGVINRWAPPNENDTKAYIDHVSSKCGVGADQVIDPRSLDIMIPLIEAIILHENGEQPYDRSTILAGVKLN
jgi:hypothetical protein